MCYYGILNMATKDEMLKCNLDVFNFLEGISHELETFKINQEANGQLFNADVVVKKFSSDDFQKKYNIPANGTVYHIEPNYTIFISDKPNIGPFERFEFLKGYDSGKWLDKYLGYHECGHIFEQHVLEDYPEENHAFYEKLNNLSEWWKNKLKEERELAADKWASQLLTLKAQEEGDEDLADLIDEEIQKKGIPTL